MVILSKGAGAKRALLRRGGTPGETRTHYIPLRSRFRRLAAVAHKPQQTLANTHFFQISFPTICHGFLLITAIF